jgi:hypothetical protein
MKFSEFVLSEGRRDTLLNKYSDAFSLEQLDYLLNDEFIKNTNYKYADFILDRLVKFYNLTPGTTHIQDAIDAVKEFDRIGKNLEKKDINQYQSLGELSMILKDYTSKSQERKIDSESEKIYEDSRILIVKPLSHKASCKYGAGTKWCTTQSSPGYFEKYSSGQNELYYIMMKDFDISNKFYKIALHISPSGQETWYDAHDIVMPPREVDILKVGLGKRANKAISDSVNKAKNKLLDEFFDPNNEHHVIAVRNFLGTKKPLVFEYKNPQIIGDGKATINLVIYLGNHLIDENKLETGLLLVAYELVHDIDTTLRMDIGYSSDENSDVNLEELSNLNVNISLPMKLQQGGINLFARFGNLMVYKILDLVMEDDNLQKHILGDKKGWYPDRLNYGFTFERGKLIHQLVNYIDSGKEGNAIDFLIDAGKITTRKLKDGKIEYIGKRGPINPKGYFSAFFASAVRAGILSYKRKNKKNILSKGKNFDTFKEGKLQPF